MAECLQWGQAPLRTSLRASERVRVWTGASAFALVESGDLFHFVRPELEVEELEVLPHARWRHRLGEHDVSALDVPPQDYLRRRLADVLGDPGDGRIVQHLALCDRRPRLGDDAVFLSVRAYGLVGEIGLHFDLVDRRNRVGLRGEPFQVVDLEVRYADGAGATVVVELLERLPGGYVIAVI